MSAFTLGEAAVKFGTTVYGETAPKTVPPK